MKLILIHGRDQQGQDPGELRQTWLDALNTGLAEAGYRFPEAVDVLFPFYGNLLDDLYQRVAAAEVRSGIIARGNGEAISGTYYDLLEELAKNAAIPPEALTDPDAAVREKGILNLPQVHWVLKQLDNYTGIGKLSLATFTGDVAFYLDNAYARDEVNKIVVKAFDNEPAVVVGHSLGSVVGYNVLHQLKGKNIRKYITVGSPLGLRTVRNKLAPPIRMPECIRDGWYNAYDDRDVVALNPLDKNNFDIEPPVFNRNNVRNYTPNRHGIEGYLSDPGVARAVYDALTGV
ncbi:MAG: hypothetical protein V4577_04410 [Bacteroidota bacterium]